MKEGCKTVIMFSALFIALFFLEISRYYDLGYFHFIWYMLAFLWSAASCGIIKQSFDDNARRLLQESAPPTPSQLQSIAIKRSVEDKNIVKNMIDSASLSCSIIAAILLFKYDSKIGLLFLLAGIALAIFNNFKAKQKKAQPPPPKADPPTQLT